MITSRIKASDDYRVDVSFRHAYWWGHQSKSSRCI